MTSHGQSTASTTARASRQRRASSGRSARGPSATTSSVGGRASSHPLEDPRRGLGPVEDQHRDRCAELPAGHRSVIERLDQQQVDARPDPPRLARRELRVGRLSVERVRDRPGRPPRGGRLRGGPARRRASRPVAPRPGRSARKVVGDRPRRRRASGRGASRERPPWPRPSSRAARRCDVLISTASMRAVLVAQFVGRIGWTTSRRGFDCSLDRDQGRWRRLACVREREPADRLLATRPDGEELGLVSSTPNAANARSDIAAAQRRRSSAGFAGAAVVGGSAIARPSRPDPKTSLASPQARAHRARPHRRPRSGCSSVRGPSQREQLRVALRDSGERVLRRRRRSWWTGSRAGARHRSAPRASARRALPASQSAATGSTTRSGSSPCQPTSETIVGTRAAISSRRRGRPAALGIGLQPDRRGPLRAGALAARARRPRSSRAPGWAPRQWRTAVTPAGRRGSRPVASDHIGASPRARSAGGSIERDREGDHLGRRRSRGAGPAAAAPPGGGSERAPARHRLHLAGHADAALRARTLVGDPAQLADRQPLAVHAPRACSRASRGRRGVRCRCSS